MYWMVEKDGKFWLSEDSVRGRMIIVDDVSYAFRFEDEQQALLVAKEFYYYLDSYFHVVKVE